jgi:hypothetical protein
LVSIACCFPPSASCRIPDDPDTIARIGGLDSTGGGSMTARFHSRQQVAANHSIRFGLLNTANTPGA